MQNQHFSTAMNRFYHSYHCICHTQILFHFINVSVDNRNDTQASTKQSIWKPNHYNRKCDSYSLEHIRIHIVKKIWPSASHRSGMKYELQPGLLFAENKQTIQGEQEKKQGSKRLTIYLDIGNDSVNLIKIFDTISVKSSRKPKTILWMSTDAYLSWRKI